MIMLLCDRHDTYRPFLLRALNKAFPDKEIRWTDKPARLRNNTFEYIYVAQQVAPRMINNLRTLVTEKVVDLNTNDKYLPLKGVRVFNNATLKTGGNL